jgi:hypothetical protein
MKQLLLFISSICLFSCGHHTRPECKNDNPAFDLYDPISNDYKRELATQLQSRDKHSIHYWIDKYIEIDKKPFMTVYVQAEGLCAKAYIDIKNPNKMQKFKNVKGISYTGKEIIGFQYAIDTVDGKILFLFEEGKVED